MNIENIVLSYIKLLDEGTLSVDDCVNSIYEKIASNNSNVDESIKAEILSYINKYKNNEVSSSDIINFLINRLNENNDPYTGGGGGGSKKPSDTEDDVVVDIETDMVLDVSEQYASIDSMISSASLSIPGGVAPFAGNLTSIIESGKNEISQAFKKTKAALVELLQGVEDVDNEVATLTKVDGFDFNDIWAMAYNKKTGSNLKVADINFFKQNKDCVINGNVVTFKKDGKTYQYDLSTKLLKAGSESVKVGFFVPSNTKEYSKLNTFTYFVANGYDNPTGYPSDAVVIRFLKGDVETRDSKGNAKFVKQKAVPEATRFINGVAKTDLSNCQNIIGGDSLYGAESLKLAAKNGNLYKTVYCVNNAVLVSGVNAQRGSKVQFDSLSELKGLNGKNIYFISASGDENFNHCARNGGGWVPCSYDQGYVFSGLDLVAQTCPNAKIYLVYSKNGKSQIKNHYYRLEKKYRNVDYLDDKWNCFAKKNYTTHTDGNRIMPELVAASVTNYNAYHA